MKNKTVVACLLMSISGFLFLISGCASTGPLTAQQANYPADKIDARGLFTENCVTCHGKNGRAHTFHGWLVGAQNFTSLEWQVDTTDADRPCDQSRAGRNAGFREEIIPVRN